MYYCNICHWYGKEPIELPGYLWDYTEHLACPNCWEEKLEDNPVDYIHVKEEKDYTKDRYGKLCLELAEQCKTDVGFGAILIKGNKIIGRGRNRRSTLEDRLLLSHVDYAIHAEQDAIANAIRNGYDVQNTRVYVLGKCLQGKNKGKLTTKTEDVFICSKCPHTFIKYNITVYIPHIEGWHPIKPEDALNIGKQMANKGYWKEFINT